MITRNKLKMNRGFTILELMVALAIFVIVSIISVSIFVMSVQNQRQAFLTQNLQDNARFILERFSKEVRMSLIENGSNQNVLHITNQDGAIVSYQFQSSNFEREGQALNSNQITVAGSFSYELSEPSQQGRATINMTLKPAGLEEPQVRVQNTVTSRQY